MNAIIWEGQCFILLKLSIPKEILRINVERCHHIALGIVHKLTVYSNKNLDFFFNCSSLTVLLMAIFEVHVVI